MPERLFTRREVLAALASVAAVPLIPGCGGERTATPSTATEANALALLDEVADNLIRLTPEQATSLGITQRKASLRSRLRPLRRRHSAMAAQIRTDLAHQFFRRQILGMQLAPA